MPFYGVVIFDGYAWVARINGKEVFYCIDEVKARATLARLLEEKHASVAQKEKEREVGKHS